MATVLEKEMLTYFTQLGDVEKESIIQMLKAFVRGREARGETALEEYNKELMTAEAEFEQGKYISHEQLLETVKKW